MDRGRAEGIRARGRFPRRAGLLAWALALLAAACAAPSPAAPAPAPAPVASPAPSPRAIAGPAISAGPCVFRVEVADAPEKRAKGLGGREVVPEDYGMLFPFTAEGQLNIWMKGMLAPIDIVWISRDQRVLRVDANAPPQPGAPDQELKVYHSPPTAFYVLELAAGRAAACGMEPGRMLEFADIPPGP